MKKSSIYRTVLLVVATFAALTYALNEYFDLSYQEVAALALQALIVIAIFAVIGFGVATIVFLAKKIFSSR